ncbi:hypothetical protein ABIE64_000499 [Thalassospira sp. MBR-102]
MGHRGIYAAVVIRGDVGTLTVVEVKTEIGANSFRGATLSATDFELVEGAAPSFLMSITRSLVKELRVMEG